MVDELFLVSPVSAEEDEESIKRRLRSFLKSIRPFSQAINSHRVAIIGRSHETSAWQTRYSIVCVSLSLSTEGHKYSESLFEYRDKYSLSDVVHRRRTTERKRYDAIRLRDSRKREEKSPPT